MEKNFKQSWELTTIRNNYIIEMEKSAWWFITLIPWHDEENVEISTYFTHKKDALKLAKQLEKEIKLKDLKEFQHMIKNGIIDGFIFKGEFISID